MKLYLSIDLESWVYPDIPSFRRLSSQDRKKLDNGFVIESTEKILELLAKHNQRITFFSLGEVFEWYPDLFLKIQEAGHEIAYHSHSHRKIENRKIMAEELLNSREFLQKFNPVGFRAPNIFLTQSALKTLAKEGFLYSSSIYGSCSDKVNISKGGLKEFPVSTFVYCHKDVRVLGYPRPLKMRMLSKELPLGSGYFIAILPACLISKLIDRLAQRNEPVIMFLHNWQIFPPKKSSFPNLWYKSTHPAYFPYTLSLKRKFEFFAKRYRLGKTIELFSG